MFKHTKPQGMWATFETTCHRCSGVLNVSNGRPEPHTCPNFQSAPNADLDLEQILTALDNR